MHMISLRKKSITILNFVIIAQGERRLEAPVLLMSELELAREDKMMAKAKCSNRPVYTVCKDNVIY